MNNLDNRGFSPGGKQGVLNSYVINEILLY